MRATASPSVELGFGGRGLRLSRVPFLGACAHAVVEGFATDFDVA